MTLFTIAVLAAIAIACTYMAHGYRRRLRLLAHQHLDVLQELMRVSAGTVMIAKGADDLIGELLNDTSVSPGTHGAAYAEGYEAASKEAAEKIKAIYQQVNDAHRAGELVPEELQKEYNELKEEVSNE